MTALEVRERRSKKTSTGIPGVSLCWTKWEYGNGYSLYLTCEAGPKHSKRIYVGTENTVDVYRFADALIHAAEWREARVKENRPFQPDFELSTATGATGIYHYWQIWYERCGYSLFLMFRAGGKQRRLYVGTQNSITVNRYADALLRAIKMRKEMGT